MATISLCMIVRNEEAVLERCLQSVADAVDEIIIVDTGSEDATRKIAARYADKVCDFTWIDDFAAARNFAYDQATMDYQMWLDADDVLPPQQRDKLVALKQILTSTTDLVTMKYNTHFDAQGVPILTSTRERLTRTEKRYRWQDPVHECIPLTGSVMHSDITIDHRKEKHEGVSARNLRIYESLEQSGRAFTPRQLYYYARELRDHGRLPKAIDYFTRFLATRQGWSEDNIAACHALGLCHRALGDEQKALSAFLRGFEYGGPRAELCCELGYHYKKKRQFSEAIEWFHAAAGARPSPFFCFLLRDYWGYIPNLEMCVCYYELDDLEQAIAHNRIAGTFKPGDAVVAQNEAFFARVKRAPSP